MPYFLEMTAPRVVATGEQLPVDLVRQGGLSRINEACFPFSRNVDLSVPTVFLEHEGCPIYFDNRTNGSGKKTYGPQAIEGEAFGAFAKAAADYILANNYDVVILNDWTAGLIALHLKAAEAAGHRVPKIIFAIHNIAFQGLFPYSLAEFLGLDARYFTINGYEYYNKMSFLKAGLLFSDMVYTVSRQYAQSRDAALWFRFLRGHPHLEIAASNARHSQRYHEGRLGPVRQKAGVGLDFLTGRPERQSIRQSGPAEGLESSGRSE